MSRWLENIRVAWFSLRMFSAVALKPSAWWSGLKLTYRFRPRYRAPLMPYLRFRMETAYGDSWQFDPEGFRSYVRWATSGAAAPRGA